MSKSQEVVDSLLDERIKTLKTHISKCISSNSAVEVILHYKYKKMEFYEDCCRLVDTIQSLIIDLCWRLGKECDPVKRTLTLEEIDKVKIVLKNIGNKLFFIFLHLSPIGDRFALTKKDVTDLQNISNSLTKQISQLEKPQNEGENQNV